MSYAKYRTNVCIVLLSQCGWTVVHFAAYNGHLEMLRELLERFNCEADKGDKVNVVISRSIAKLLSAQSFTSIVTISWYCPHVFLNTPAQVDPPVCSCIERPYRNCSIFSGRERL